MTFFKVFCPFLSIRSGLVSPAYLASPLDFSYIVSQLGRFVKRSFRQNWTFFTRCTISPPWRPLWGPPLDITDYTTPASRLQLAEYTKSGKIIDPSLCNFSLDKLLGLWYNGNSARPHMSPGRQKTTPKRGGWYQLGRPPIAWSIFKTMSSAERHSISL